MTRTNLKLIMMRNGTSITQIASKIGVNNRMIYDVLCGARTSKRIQAALEETFDLPIDKIRKAWNTIGKPVMTPEIKHAMESFNMAVNM